MMMLSARMSSGEKEGARQVRIQRFSDVKAVWFVFSGCASSFGSRDGGWETRVSRNDGSRRVATKWDCGHVLFGFLVWAGLGVLGLVQGCLLCGPRGFGLCAFIFLFWILGLAHYFINITRREKKKDTDT